MFGRYQLAAVLFLGIFGAAMVANSAVTQPAPPEVSEPRIQLAQVYSACRSCLRMCGIRNTICQNNAHSPNSVHMCRVRHHRCVGGCGCWYLAGENRLVQTVESRGAPRSGANFGSVISRFPMMRCCDEMPAL